MRRRPVPPGPRARGSAVCVPAPRRVPPARPPDHRPPAVHDSKGISASAIPYKKTPPSWQRIEPEKVEEQVCKLAKKGLTPSQIGVILRDSHGIPQVNSITGSKVLRLLKKNGA